MTIAEAIVALQGIKTYLSSKSCEAVAEGNDLAVLGFKESVTEISGIIELLKQPERKHGHWLVLWDCSNGGVYCSECRNKMFDKYPMKKKFSQYCGHCGAVMDGEVEEK